jgi:hypothetical protein
MTTIESIGAREFQFEIHSLSERNNGSQIFLATGHFKVTSKKRATLEQEAH